jgi:formylmethanofuran dehydrogenase subunit E
MRFAVCCLVLGLAACCCGAEPEVRLPIPDFRLDPADPAWLGPAVQLHGHLGPWLVAGVRMGAAGLRAVRGNGYFDVEITVEGPLALPPQACFLDGIQVATGATLGKRNLKWTEARQLAVRVKNVRTGKSAIVRPAAAMMEWIASAKGVPLSPANPGRASAPPGEDHDAKDAHAVDAIARRIAKAAESELLTIAGE